MPSALESVASAFTPGLVRQLAGSLGLNTGQIQKGLKLAGPLLVMALARKAQAPRGSATVANLLTKLPAYAGDDPAGMVDRLRLGNLGNRLLGRLLGNQNRAVITSLLRSSAIPGLDALLNMATPAALAQISKTMNHRKTDATALAKKLQQEAATLAKSDNDGARLVACAFAEADAQRELKSSIGRRDWAAVSSAPLLAVGHVAAARCPMFFSNPAGAPRERALLTDLFDPAGIPGDSTLVDAAVNSIQDLLFETLGDNLPWDLGDVDLTDPARVKAKVLDRLSMARHALAPLPAHEQADYKKLIVDAAIKMAEAEKEGGFLGLGGRKISDSEQAAIDDIKIALYG